MISELIIIIHLRATQAAVTVNLIYVSFRKFEVIRLRSSQLLMFACRLFITFVDKNDNIAETLCYI